MPFIKLGNCVVESECKCASMCPTHAIEIREIKPEESAALSFFERLKMKGRNKAFLSRPDRCVLCGLCVALCPERAIKLM